MKKLIPDEKFHGHIEKCGFAISFYHNDEDDKLFDTLKTGLGSKETINDFFFLRISYQRLTKIMGDLTVEEYL